MRGVLTEAQIRVEQAGAKHPAVRPGHTGAIPRRLAGRLSDGRTRLESIRSTSKGAASPQRRQVVFVAGALTGRTRAGGVIAQAEVRPAG